MSTLRAITAAYRRRRWLHSFRGGLWPLAVGLAPIAALVVVAALLATVGNVARSLTLNLLTGGAIGGAGYLYFFWWTRRRATRRVRKVAWEAPAELFRAPPVPHIDHVVGREELVRQIAEDLRRPFRAGPQIVVGRTGSGKTTVLLLLAHYFAERGVVPVPVSLRGEKELDFWRLAHDRFMAFVDPYVASQEEAERVWRSLLLRNQVVILADDLDAATADDLADEQRAATRRALEDARERGLALVVTSRRVGVPVDLEKLALELDEATIPDDAAVGHVIARAGLRQDDADRDRVAAVVSAGGLGESPFYLGVAAELLAVGKLPALDPTLHGMRLALLDGYREALIAGDLAEDPRVPRAERERAVNELEGIGAGTLVDGSEFGVPAQAASSPTRRRDVYVAERLGLLELVDAEGNHDFAHEVVHAYLASRLLRRDAQLRAGAITAGGHTPTVQLALILAAAAEPGVAAETCQGLLEMGRALPPDQRLLVVAAAAEVARAARIDHLDEALANPCIELRAVAGQLAKLAAIRQLGALGTAPAFDALWTYTTDEDYGVRWAAATALADRGVDAYRALSGRFRRHLAAAEAMATIGDRPLDDWVEPVLSLKHMAWLLPTLRTAARQAGDQATLADVEDDLKRLLDLEGSKMSDAARAAGRRPITEQRGLEASITQGYKADALRNPEEAPDPVALRLLADAKFWYSRLNALHAVAIRALHSPDPRARELGERLKAVRRHDPHPFVKEAARLARQGSREDWSRYVWDDEGRVVARRPDRLVDGASQLVGDIAVLLNMNEAGAEESRERFGKENVLPYCFAGSRDREEVFDIERGCRCEFKLCPYREATGRRSAHRELSKAFCAHQRVLARRRVARRWESRASAGALRAFWARLESRARI